MTTKNQKILIAAADADMRGIIEGCLKNQYSIVSASDGLEAWDLIQANDDIDVIIADFQLPKINGGELLKKVRGNRDIRGTAFLMIIERDAFSKINIQTPTADDYITKPVNTTELLIRIGNLLKIKVLEETLKQQIITDPETGLTNQWYFMKRFNEEIERSTRYGGEFSVIILEIDNFDSLDTAMRNSIFAQLANIISDQIRKVDIISRLHTYMIGIILPNTGLDKAYITAERIETYIENHGFSYKDKPYQIVINAGISSFEKGMDDAETMIKRAEDALFKAKG